MPRGRKEVTHMESQELKEIIRRIDALTPRERLLLIARLTDQCRDETSRPKPRKKWRDIAGAVKYPMTGMDAQEWVSQSRAESDCTRAAQLELDE